MTRIHTFKFQGYHVPVWYDPAEHARVVVQHEADLQRSMQTMGEANAIARHSELSKHRYEQRPGLAWTPLGHDLLPVEVAPRPGQGHAVPDAELAGLLREPAEAVLTLDESRDSGEVSGRLSPPAAEVTMGTAWRVWTALAATLAGASLGLAGMAPSRAATQSGWRIVFSRHYPQSNGAYSAYGTVVAPGRANAWALGGSQWASNGGYPVAEHWNGTRWRAAALPVGLHGWIAAASASSPANVWAVSLYNGYVLHWNGSRWSVAKRWKEASYPSALTGVTAISRTDVWVFGGEIPGVTPLVGLGTWHFNGKTWTKIGGQGRNVAQASALSASNIWGIGGYHPAYPQVDHYNGTTWRAVPIPAALGTPRYILAVSAHDVWLAGENTSTAQAHPVLIRWNGSRWRRVTPDAPAASVLGPISADGHGGVWIAAQSTERTQAWLLHRSGSGAWTRNTLRAASLVEGLARLPGNTSMWATGAYFNTAGGTAAIWAHGPVG